MNRLQCLIRLARALDYNRDPDPKHWKTINGAHVHVDENGGYDGGAGGKFTGRHHYGPDWKQKTALTNRLANALRGGVTQKQAQGNQAGNQTGNTSAQNAASKGNIWPNGAKVKFEGVGCVEIFPLKDGGERFVVRTSVGQEIRKYPGGMNAFLKKLQENGYAVSERNIEKRENKSLPIDRDSRRMARASKRVTRAMVRGRPEGAR